MITFEYSDNSQAISSGLESFQRSLADSAPAFAEIADDFREMMAAQFASQGAAEGTPWAPRKSRRSVGAQHAAPLLQQTGALRDSLTREGASSSKEDIAANTLSIGSRVPYAIFHQFGTGRTPARPLIVLSDARSAKWTEFVRKAMEGRLTVLSAKELGGGQL